MKARIKSWLRAAWFTLIMAIALLSLFPRGGSYLPLLGPYVDRGWAHFTVYACAATLCMLAWKNRTAMFLASGLFLLSVGLHLLHNFRAGIGADSFAIIVNLFGTAAGVLLGLNLHTLRTRMKKPVTVGGYPNQ
jgi:hypothetical protein